MLRFALVILGVGLVAGCSLDRSVRSERDVGQAGADVGMDAASDTGVASEAGVDAGRDAGFDLDGGGDSGLDSGSATDAGADAGVDAGSDAGSDTGRDAGRDAGNDAGSDGGTDAGTCPGAPTGVLPCPFTNLAQLGGVATGTYAFRMAGLSFRALVDHGGGSGWMLVASADETTVGLMALATTSSGPVNRQSHSIFDSAVIAALPDAMEVRIDSSGGSNTMASVRSTDSYVLDQFRGFRSLHTTTAELGSVRWLGGDADRMTSTCANAAPMALDRLIFQTCGAAGDNLHWAPAPVGFPDSPDRLNSWVYSSATRDRLNLWVRN